MDEGFRQFLERIETTRQDVSLALHVALRASSRSQLDNVVSTIRQQLREQSALIEDLTEAMKRRELLRSIGTLGVPALLPESAVRAALTTPAPDGPTASLTVIRSAVAQLWEARQASRYEQLAGSVPGVLAAIQRRNATCDDANDYLSLTYQAIAGSMAELQHHDVAWVASERGIVAAKQSGNAAIMASAERRHAQTLMSMGRSVEAEQVALAAAETLSAHDHLALSIYGALLNTCAIAAARQDEPTSANRYLREAGQAADHVGEGYNHLFTAFGPTNVALHRLSAAVELGDGGSAIVEAKAIDVAVLPAERQAHFRVDMAQANVQEGNNSDALAILLEAEALAPEEIRYHPSARSLIALLLRSNSKADVQALAERSGVTA